MIYVCGDSFNTSDKDYPNQSWYDKFSTLVNSVVFRLSDWMDKV